MSADLHTGKRAPWHTPLWWGLLAASLVVAAITARLGWWQLERAQAKEALHALNQSRQVHPPLRNADWQVSSVPTDWLHRRTEVHGRWLPQWTVFLDNRSMGAQSGFYVLTPLQLPEGQVLWVQRGWAPRDRVRSDLLPPVDTPVGSITLQAKVIPPPSKLMELGASGPAQNGFSPLRQNVDLAEFRLQTGVPILATLLQTGEASDGLKRDWPPILSGADKNRGYAFQWFALSLLSLFLFAWFQIWKKRAHD